MKTFFSGNKLEQYPPPYRHTVARAFHQEGITRPHTHRSKTSTLFAPCPSCLPLRTINSLRTTRQAWRLSQLDVDRCKTVQAVLSHRASYGTRKRGRPSPLSRSQTIRKRFLFVTSAIKWHSFPRYEAWCPGKATYTLTQLVPSTFYFSFPKFLLLLLLPSRHDMLALHKTKHQTDSSMWHVSQDTQQC